MEEIENIIKKESLNIPEENREEWVKSCLEYSKICLEKGDSVKNAAKSREEAIKSMSVSIAGGFTWKDTIEGDDFWRRVFNGNHSMFYKKYPIKGKKINIFK